MKVGGLGPTPPTAPGRRSERSGATSSGQFARALESGANEAEALHSAAPASSLDALIAIQEVNPDGRRPRRAVLRGKALLDSLDTIRDALLSGTLSAERLAVLRDLVAVDRESVEDPRLAELLDEIDLRAQVELAKLTHSE
jgi:hypothetical protein